MNTERFQTVAGKYSRLRIALVGDFCLDRYLEIDPARNEVSIETSLAVRNVVNIRSQPGGAGTILNNLVALGIGEIYPVGFAGDDGEGFELIRALRIKPGVRLDHFVQTPDRHTFTYTKPLVLEAGQPPQELNRLDIKNWMPTPANISEIFCRSIDALAAFVDAIIVLDQVDVPDTGVVTPRVLEILGRIAHARPGLLIIADSRRGLRDFPAVTFKMNAAELARMSDASEAATIESIAAQASALARKNARRVFVTLAENGILGASPDGNFEHVPTFPVRGEIDIVGAGDSVTANLAASLAAGASLRESLEIANAAASIVIHQLGTTGTATVAEIGGLLASASAMTAHSQPNGK